MFKMSGLRVRAISVLACGLALAGCSSVPVAPPSDQIFQDHLFRPSTQHIDAADVFAISPAMRSFADVELSPLKHKQDRRQGLIDALYKQGKLKLDYDSEKTRTAAEAFDSRSGNCMSLVLMTGAFAKHLNLPVRFRNVFVGDNWSREGGIYFLSGHVNLRLSDERYGGFGSNMLPTSLIVDFLPSELLGGERAVEVGEQTIIAMYMNNRAAETLNAGTLDDAYAWAREALRQDPKYMAAYNTLGVIYRRHGNTEAAERTLRYVLTVEPANVQALSNMILVLNDLGRASEAARMAATLHELQPYPPFRYFDLGMQEMKLGNYVEARDLFRKELARAAYYHEFHFWMSLASYSLGDLDDARKHMALAEENSTTNRDHSIYAGKLAWLKSRKAEQPR